MRLTRQQISSSTKKTAKKFQVMFSILTRPVKLFRGLKKRKVMRRETRLFFQSTAMLEVGRLPEQYPISLLFRLPQLFKSRKTGRQFQFLQQELELAVSKLLLETEFQEHSLSMLFKALAMLMFLFHQQSKIPTSFRLFQTIHITRKFMTNMLWLRKIR